MPQFRADYTYLGDRNTALQLKGCRVAAVRNAQGKCIRGRNGSMLVALADGKRLVVLARLLRKIPEIPLHQ